MFARLVIQRLLVSGWTDVWLEVQSYCDTFRQKCTKMIDVVNKQMIFTNFWLNRKFVVWDLVGKIRAAICLFENWSVFYTWLIVKN